MKKYKEETTETRPAPTLKEGPPKRKMLRELTVLNPGMSRNQGKRSPEMAKIGGGAPSTIWKRKFIECT